MDKRLIKDDILPLTTTNQTDILPLTTTNQTDNNDELLIDEKFIREEEKDKIRFSINGIVSFCKKITDEELYDWISLYNKNDLVIDYQNGV